MKYFHKESDYGKVKGYPLYTRVHPPSLPHLACILQNDELGARRNTNSTFSLQIPQEKVEEEAVVAAAQGHALKIGAETRADLEATAAPHVVGETRVKEIMANASRIDKMGADEAEENREEGVAEEEGTTTPEEPRSIGYVLCPSPTLPALILQVDHPDHIKRTSEKSDYTRHTQFDYTDMSRIIDPRETTTSVRFTKHQLDSSDTSSAIDSSRPARNKREVQTPDDDLGLLTIAHGPVQTLDLGDRVLMKKDSYHNKIASLISPCPQYPENRVLMTKDRYDNKMASLIPPTLPHSPHERHILEPSSKISTRGDTAQNIKQRNKRKNMHAATDSKKKAPTGDEDSEHDDRSEEGRKEKQKT
jgi:hypothetical protein